MNKSNSKNFDKVQKMENKRQRKQDKERQKTEAFFGQKSGTSIFIPHSKETLKVLSKYWKKNNPAPKICVPFFNTPTYKALFNLDGSVIYVESE